MTDPRREPTLFGEEPVEDLDELNESLPSSFSINAYGADYPVDGLARRMEQRDIVVPRFSVEPEEGQSTVGFQREYVWRKPQADRFIESLLLGLPVPGIFLVKEADGKHLVLDGQQRLHAISAFYNGVLNGKQFALESVQERWVGKTYKTLNADDRRRLDDSIIHATIVRQEEPSEDQSSIYLIFERLNSGGTLLQPQEIRVALYHGEFASLLSSLNGNLSWRRLYGRKSARLKDIELILRFFAPMKEFLNRYMATNRNFGRQSAPILTEIFENTVDSILRAIGERAFRPRSVVNAAVLDSVMVGVASAIALGDSVSDATLKASYDSRLDNKRYLALVKSSTADEENVQQRINLAKNAFATVG